MPRQKKAEPDIFIDNLHPINDGFLHAYNARWTEQGIIALLALDIVETQNWRPGHYLTSAYELVLLDPRTVSGRPLGSIQQGIAGTLQRKLRDRMLDGMKGAGWREVDTTREGRPIYQYRPAPRLILVPAPQPATEETLVDRESDLPDIDLAGAGADLPGEAQVQRVEHKVKLADQDQVRQVELADQGTQPEPRQSHVIEVIGSAEAKERGQQPAYSREVFTRPVTFTCIVCKTTVTQQRYPGHIPLYCGDGCKGERQRENTQERVARHREKKKKAAAATSASQESSPSS